MMIPYLNIVFTVGLVAAPYYFFNRYLIKKIRPYASGKRLALFFISVIITALLYSALGILLMAWFTGKH